MEPLDKRRKFIINIAYWAIIAAIAYVILRYLLNLLLPFVIALLVSWLLRPLCRFYRRKLHRQQKLASALTVATVLVFYLLIGGLALLLLLRILTALAEYIGRLPTLYTQTIEPGLRDLYASAQDLAERFDPSVVDLVNRILPEIISSAGSAVTSFSVSAVGRITGFVTGIPSFLISALIAIIATIFTAVSYDSIKAFLRKNLPAKFTETAGYVINSFRSILFKFGTSYLLVMVITFAEISLGLVIIGVRRPFLSAALIAVFDIFPIVGAGMILIPWAGISLLQAKLLQAVGLVLLYVVVIVVRQFLEPKLVGEQVGLPPLVTLACMFVGSSLFGVWGLFGLPIGAAILVNLNNDPNIPIHIFSSDPQEEPKAARMIYRFRKRREAAKEKAGKENKEENKP
ncbi:MAG: sporulation integral membrane protein YtvI [Oscillospiraceae bacterium]|nr:sporulation integral membrane protein YtvI [Oscillospiraceae bacterium]